MNKVNGFIELNGKIYKISSVEELKSVAEQLGQAFQELTRADYQKMCRQLGSNEDFMEDDCGVRYSEDGQRLIYLSKPLQEYKITDGTTAIAEFAFSNWSYWDGVRACYSSRLYNKRGIHNLHIPDSIIEST